jgi:hypothetical protein
MTLPHTVFLFLNKGMRVLVDAREKLHIPWGDNKNQLHGDKLMAFDTRAPMAAQGMVETRVFLQYLPAIRALWEDSGIQNAYDRRREFQLVRHPLLQNVFLCIYFYDLRFYFCVRVGTCTCQHMCRHQRTLVGVGSPLAYRFWVLNSGPQAWWQVFTCWATLALKCAFI